MSQPPSPPPPPRPPASVADLEVKDPILIFNAVWDDLLEKYGRDNLRFPREFIWLGGAPGAGKGTNTPFITHARGLTAPPVVVSDLLKSPEAVALKNAGKMVGDRVVIGLLFEELLKPEYHHGVIVDGFPRTKVQVECLKKFYDAMLLLHKEHRGTPLAAHFPKPLFEIAMLYVSEQVSVSRQLKRGRDTQEHNRLVRETGVGKLMEDPRPTDLDPALCRKRYETYRDTTYNALQELKGLFYYRQIDAEGDLGEVQENILREFGYQSSLELSPEVFDLIHHIPVASELGKHARQELVVRLEQYQEDHRELFEKVIRFIEGKLIPIVRAHSITGHARINTENPLLSEQENLALRMMIDVFSERGYHASVDVHLIEVPDRVNLQTGEITCRTKKVYRIEVRYPPSAIRRGH